MNERVPWTKPALQQHLDDPVIEYVHVSFKANRETQFKLSLLMLCRLESSYNEETVLETNLMSCRGKITTITVMAKS